MAREIKISSLKQQPEEPIGKSAAFGSVSLYNKRLGALIQKRVQEYAFKNRQKPIGSFLSTRLSQKDKAYQLILLIVSLLFINDI